MGFPTLQSKAILSPVAGVTDVAFRALCKQYGAGLTCTEFVSSTALVRESKKSLEMITTDSIENPVAVQLFGHSPQDIVSAAQLVEERFDVIDINCGCPAWKVIKTGAGSAMLNNPAKIADLVRHLVKVVDVPITVKIRSGIDEKRLNAVTVAKAVEDAGGAAIAVHGRTQQQGYRGKADWKIIKQVKNSVNIPVIGNGDVTTPEIFKKRLEETGVDAIMIARGAMNNPLIFTQIKNYLKKGHYEEIDRKKMFNDLMKFAKKHALSVIAVKQHAMRFTKGINGGAKLRNEILQCKEKKDISLIFNRI